MSENKPIVNRIEVEEGTAEPIIVEVSESELIEEELKREDENVKEADFFKDNENVKSMGKQLVMTSLGITKDEDKNIGKRQKIFSISLKVVFILFVIGALAFTFYNDFFGDNSERMSSKDIDKILSKNWYYVFCAIGALVACYFLKAFKLSILCKPLSGKFHFKTCFETAIIGHYYNYVTPLAVGGQPFEIYHLSKHGVHGGVASALPIATYVLNQFAYVIMGFVSLIMFKYNTFGLSSTLKGAFPVTFTVMAIVGLSLCMLAPSLVILFSLMPRFGAKIVHLVVALGAKFKIIKDPKKTTYKIIKNVIHNAQCLKKIFRTPISALVCFAMSFLEHFSYASLAFFTLMLFGFGSGNPGLMSDSFMQNWAQIVQLAIMLSCAVSFIPTPGNAGAADLSFSLLFNLGLATGLTFTATVVWRCMSFYSFIIIGFIFATVKKRADKFHERKKSLK